MNKTRIFASGGPKGGLDNFVDYTENQRPTSPPPSESASVSKPANAPLLRVVPSVPDQKPSSAADRGLRTIRGPVSPAAESIASVESAPATKTMIGPSPFAKTSVGPAFGELATCAFTVDELFARRLAALQAAGASPSAGAAVSATPPARRAHGRLAALFERVLRASFVRRLVARWRATPARARTALALSPAVVLLVLVVAALAGQRGRATPAPTLARATSNAVPAAKSQRRAPVATASSVAPQAAPAAATTAGSRLTLERSAADAAAEGRYAAAIQLYERLAQSRPDRRVFREAARILADRTRELSERSR